MATQKEMVRSVFANGTDIKAPVKDVLAAIKQRYKTKISGNVVSTVRQEILRSEPLVHENPDALLSKVSSEIRAADLIQAKEWITSQGGMKRVAEMLSTLTQLGVI